MDDRKNATLAEVDPLISRAIDDEVRRQAEGLELIASENFVSEAVLEAMGSVFTNKYAEGYPGKRYYGGCEFTDVVEQAAIDRAKEIFGAEHANVQPHSGSQANMAVYLAALQYGDTILGMNLSHGGHLTHGHPLNFSGFSYKVADYGVSRETETDRLRRAGAHRQGEQAEDDRLRRVGLPAQDRLRAHRRDRQGGRRADDGRHRAHRRPHRGGTAPLARPARRLRDDHHAQDPARPARRPRPLPRRARGGSRSETLPRHPGRPARPHHRGEGRRLRRGARARTSGNTSAASSRTRRRSPTVCKSRASASSRAARTTTSCWWTCSWAAKA